MTDRLKEYTIIINLATFIDTSDNEIEELVTRIEKTIDEINTMIYDTEWIQKETV